MSLPVVAIVGRPNVGKSTFFNRCVGARRAIVDDSPGITRDRLYQEAEWAGYKFLLVDTGGLGPATAEAITDQVADQTKLAINESDVVVFMVDGKAGVTGSDRNVASLLRKSPKPVILAVNKIDEIKQQANTVEFYELGLGEPAALSALQGDAGVGDLLDRITSSISELGIAIKESKKKKELEFETELSQEDADTPVPKDFSVAIVGRPNVGKSSILNCLAGTHRTIVDSAPGTTRDAIDTVVNFGESQITLTDTAGIRRRSKVMYGVEAFAVVRSLSAIDRSDVAVLVLDATEPVSEQDQRIATRIEKSGKAAIIVLNKWDLVGDRSSKHMNELTEEIHSQLRQLGHARIVFTSALKQQRVNKILEATQQAWQQSKKRIGTSTVNRIINEAVALSPPPSGSRGRRLRISYSTQVSAAPPTFLLFVNDGKLLTSNYTSYLERKLREAFGFEGATLRIITRNKQ
jgi:GTP-binding protein